MHATATIYYAKHMGLDMSHNYLCEHKNNLCVNMWFVNVKHHPQMHLKDLQTHKYICKCKTDLQICKNIFTKKKDLWISL